jgi:hypothetical protein
MYMLNFVMHVFIWRKLLVEGTKFCILNVPPRMLQCMLSWMLCNPTGICPRAKKVGDGCDQLMKVLKYKLV